MIILLYIFGVCYILSLIGICLNSRSLIKSLIFIELMLASLNGMFIVASVAHDDFTGQIIALCILAVAAAESAIGLGLLIIFYRTTGSVSLIKNINLLH